MPFQRFSAPTNGFELNNMDWRMRELAALFMVFRNDRALLLLGTIALVAVWRLFVIYLHRQQINSYRIRIYSGKGVPESSLRSTDTKDPNKDREHGEWTPVDFTYPEITPHPQDMADTKPIPYRPFRWGEYHVTMGIRSMRWDEWIEIDQQFPTYHRIRAYRLRTRGEKALAFRPAKPGVVGSAYGAAIELVHDLAEYLSRRYPTTYQTTRYDGPVLMSAPTQCRVRYAYGWYGAPHVKSITISPMGVTYDIPLDPADDGELVWKEAAERALEVATLITQDDLALMVEGNDGRYYFQGGAISVPGFWRMQEKLGLPLEEIHLSGNVPQYKEKLQMSMERYFRRMTVDKPVTRNNYFVQIVQPEESGRQEGSDVFEMDPLEVDPEELAWSTTTNGPEDAQARELLYRMARKRAADGSPRVLSGPPIVRADTLRLRSERQTLRRLPRSGAIVFGIRTYVSKAEGLGMENGVPGRLASALRGWGEDVVRYKGATRYRDVLLEYLDRCHASQVAEGLVAGGEYPF